VLYLIAVVLGIVAGIVIVADRTLTACAREPSRYPAMPPGAPLRKRYIECMALGTLAWLGGAVFLYTEVGHIGLAPFIIVGVAGFLSYQAFTRVDRSIHKKFGNSPLT
jgi:hypothetical protein